MSEIDLAPSQFDNFAFASASERQQSNDGDCRRVPSIYFEIMQMGTKIGKFDRR